MNPQQMQQVRTIAQEQFQPFLQQHKLLIEELSNKIKTPESNPSNKKALDDRISQIIEQENKIKLELKKENDVLREMLADQKNNFDQQQIDLNKQVTTILSNFKESIQPELDNTSERVDKLEKGEISVSLPAKDIADAIENYYQTSIKCTSLSIAALTATLLDLNTKKKEYETLQEELKDTEKCIEDGMNNIILQSINKTISDIRMKIERFNIEQMDENIKTTEEEILKLKNKLEQFKRHHL